MSAGSSPYSGLAAVSVDYVREFMRRVVGRVDAVLSAREELRDKLIRLGRDIIKLSGWIINALHRGSIEEAKKYVGDIDKIAAEYISEARKDPSLWFSGLVSNALSEYVEAKLFYGLIVEGRLYSYEELGVGEIPYLQGVGDVLGELRRLALDMLRVNRISDAERILSIMEAIYYELRALEYPDALMPGVRHKVDVARRLIDDTKALLITVKSRLNVCESM